MISTSYSFAQVAAMMGGEVVKGSLETAVNPIYTDSRKPQANANSLFIAIKGDRHDGNLYVQELYERGQRNFVLSYIPIGLQIPDANVILVKDGLGALQSLAASHRKRYSYPVIGITGSNGKTTLKEWLYQLLHPHYQIVRSPRSYNSQLGVPLSVWLMNETHNLAIFEAGISLRGEMEKLEKILSPDIGIFTNIGDAHQENFQSTEEKIREKMNLFKHSKMLIFCKDHVKIAETVNKEFNREASPELRFWSTNEASHLKIISHKDDRNGTTITGIYKEIQMEIWIPFKHPAAIENACHCWLLMLELGISEAEISQSMKLLSPIEMRMEMLEGINGCVVLNDAYNSDVVSLGIALEYLRQQGKNKRRTAIVSDIAQSGEKGILLYSKVATLLKANGVERVIGIGAEISKFTALFDNFDAAFYIDTDAFLLGFMKEHFSNEDILLKGARSFAFERIGERLTEKTHETVLETDLNRITDNLNFIKSKLKPSTKIMAMVKAFAYGSGSYEVARLLQHSRVDYLAVAYADEGIALRKAGITLPILVLNPEFTAYRAMIDFDLEPQIFNFRTLHQFAKVLEQVNAGGRYSVHIKINTGMNRLGFDPEEITMLGKVLQSHSKLLEVGSVFSHLSASDDEAFELLTEKQLERFQNAIGELSKYLSEPFLKHILNSNGVTRHPEAQMDMVRIGLALYGLSSHPEARRHLKPAGKLITTVSQIRLVAVGEGIGYSPKQILSSTRKIAVLPIGYADGLPRKLGNGNWKVYINGSFAPIVGNVCMDMCMIDVTNIECKEGYRVEVFGDHADIYSMAIALETIPYEILTHVSQRVKRVYIQE